MPVCSKCGYETTEDMSFCPRCGASLKIQQSPSEQRASTPRHRDEKAEKHEKHEKHEKREKTEKHEKGEYGLIGPLIGGLVLILIGLMSYLQVSGVIGENNWRFFGAFLVIIIGVIILVAALYFSTMAKRRSPAP